MPSIFSTASQYVNYAGLYAGDFVTENSQGLYKLGFAATALAGLGIMFAACKRTAPQTVIPSPEPTTSGYLRWLNIWLDAHKRNLTGAGKDVLVLGPGKRLYGNKEHCPQMAEAFKLWNGSRFTVLDSNQSVLDAVRSIDHQLSLPFISKTFQMNGITTTEANEKALRELTERLTSAGQPRYKLRTMNFRMGLDRLPKDLTLLDAIIGTFSLFYPIKNLAETGKDEEGEQRIELLGQFLTQLKPGGALYVEKDCLTALLAKAEDLEDKEKLRTLITATSIRTLKRKIEESVGVKVDLKRLPLLIDTIKIQGQPFVAQPRIKPEDSLCTQTSDAYVFVRRSSEAEKDM